MPASELELPAVSIAPDENWIIEHEAAEWTLTTYARGALAALEAPALATLSLTATVDGETAQDERVLTFTAADTFATNAAPELLAAHVFPNDPALVPLLSSARAQLGISPASPASDANDSTHIRRVLAAAVSSIAGLGISPIAQTDGAAGATNTTSLLAPPDDPRPEPSPVDVQLARTPTSLVAAGEATPLELALLLTAACEALGLRAVLVRASGQSFVGVLTTDRSLATTVVTDIDDLHPLVTDGELLLVDSLSALATHQPASTEHHAPLVAAISSSARWLEQDAEGFLDATDITSAREQIRPLKGESSDAPGGNARYDEWARSLLDLSLRNPLVNLTSNTGVSLRTSEASLGTFEDLLVQGKSVLVRGNDDVDAFVDDTESDDVESNDAKASGRAATTPTRGQSESKRTPSEALLERLLDERGVLFARTTGPETDKRLRTLKRNAERIVRETGTNDLFVAIGTLRWCDTSGTWANAPMLLLPVVIEGPATGPFTVRVDEDGRLLPNESLLERLRLDYGITLSSLRRPPQEELGVNVHAFLAQVRAELAESDLPFTVMTDAHLAVLQFTTLDLWRDVTQHREVFRKNHLVRHLVETPGAAFEQPGAAIGRTKTESASYLPVPADGSQLRAIDLAAKGATFVLEGPPGTGKSQTITNMIANAVAQGRTVLFVAEKPAALEIVRRKLIQVGLGYLHLDIHGRDLSARAVRGQILNARSARFESDLEALERLRSEHAEVVERLDAFPQAMTAEGPAGLSIGEAQRRIDALTARSTDEIRRAADGATVSTDVAQGRIPMTDALRAAKRLDVALDHVRRTRAIEAWSLMGRVPGQRAAFADVAEQIRDVYAALSTLPASLRRLLEYINDPEAWLVLTPWLADIDGGRTLDPAEFERRDRSSWAAKLRTLAHELRTFVQAGDGALDSSERSAASLADSARELGLADADASAVLAGGLQRDADELAGRVERFADVHARFQASESIGDLVSKHAGGALSPALSRLVTALRRLLTSLGARQSEIERWLNRRSMIVRLIATQEIWLKAAESGGERAYSSYADLLEAASDLEFLGFDQFVADAIEGNLPPSTLDAVLELAMLHSIQRERLESSEISKLGDDQHRMLAKQYLALSDEIRRRLHDDLPAKLRADRGVDTEHPDAAQSALREVVEPRKGVAIAKLFHEHRAALLDLTPIILASPHAVASYFPAIEGMFDLLVFDEASQIRVPDALGALGRSTSVVIVGDAAQLPPTSVFQQSTAIVGDDEPDTADHESILTVAATANVPRHKLTWHYRSRDERLIEFSNENYYRKRLRSFPSPPTDDGDTGPSFMRVNGLYDREDTKTNLIEAEAIVAEIVRRLEIDPRASIGVVTLSAKQRELIHDLLDQEDNKHVRRAFALRRDELFVKNLENAQGDERDVILLSLAFSRPADGREMPLTFGPITRSGGEKRLNVAITRARKRTIVFASFGPEDMNVTSRHSRGLRDLKSYLERLVAEVVEGGSTSTPRRASPLRSQLAGALRERGFEVREDVGHSTFRVDLAVRTPEGSWRAVLLDTAAVAEQSTTADRVGIPEAVLIGLGWAGVSRVLLADVLRDEAEVIDRLEEDVAAATQTTTTYVDDEDEDDGFDDDESDEPQTFTPADSSQRHEPAAMDDETTLRRELLDVIETERVINHKRLARIVGQRFGLERVHRGRRDRMLGVLPAHLRRPEADGLVFYWSPSVEPDAPIPHRPAPDRERSITEISHAELASATGFVLRRGGLTTRKKLIDAVRDEFGFVRLGTPMRVRIEGVIEELESRGEIRFEGDTPRATAADPHPSPKEPVDQERA